MKYFCLYLFQSTLMTDGIYILYADVEKQFVAQ